MRNCISGDSQKTTAITTAKTLILLNIFPPVVSSWLISVNVML